MNLTAKYRPTKLAEIVGQERVVKAFRNAAIDNKLDKLRAVLFTGGRGMGKTSTARIVAKLHNCLDIQDGEPCNVCENCKAVDDSIVNNTGDVIEVDAATNKGIENIQNIIEQSRYSTGGKMKRKVWIIDEIHQLSYQAKDALLKTLEEPPENVCFILATTERTKLPLTVSSRCVAFPFKEGSKEDIGAYLVKVLKDEKVPFEIEAVDRIAELANGSYREALQYIESIVVSDGKLTAKLVSENLGIPTLKELQDLVRLVYGGKIAEATTQAAKLISDGCGGRLLLREVSNELMKIISSMAAKGKAIQSGISCSDIFEIVLYIDTKLAGNDMNGMLACMLITSVTSSFKIKREANA